MHGVRRTSQGTFRVRLSAREHELLASLPEQLRQLLADEADPARQVRARLFPRAYDDAEAEREYRDLVGADLGDQREAALATFAETLAGGTRTRLSWSAELDEEQTAAWLSATNDARLALGVLLGITDEAEWARRRDDRDPATVLLHYLGWLQEELLDALQRGLA